MNKIHDHYKQRNLNEKYYRKKTHKPGSVLLGQTEVKPLAISLETWKNDSEYKSGKFTCLTDKYVAEKRAAGTMILGNGVYILMIEYKCQKEFEMA